MSGQDAKENQDLELKKISLVRNVELIRQLFNGRYLTYDVEIQRRNFNYIAYITHVIDKSVINLMYHSGIMSNI